MLGGKILFKNICLIFLCLYTERKFLKDSEIIDVSVIVCIYVYVYFVYVYLCMCVYMCMYVCICVLCVCLCVCVCMFTPGVSTVILKPRNP